uniref:CDP-alcohol phosphatidyltransferase family protein n=1 Tax=Actinomyces bovis TaxID=1658 RepID=UPI001E342C44|nr:CDP-alcohol phosphatidyltransferase family protein [Actinomyces bovis]
MATAPPPQPAVAPTGSPALPGGSGTTPPKRNQVLAGWAVHAFTMSGIVWASLALLALYEGSLKLMWLWLVVALVVDGVDGTLARRVRIKEAVPWFDGSVTDIIIDYLTWTFIPGVFMYLHLPLGPKSLAGVLVLVALISSLFCYANEGEKSADNYFVGFPAAWNVVAVMMWVLHTPALFNVVCLVALAILTLVPTHYAHPMRVVKRRSLLIALVLAWMVGTIWLVVVYPSRPLPAMLLSVVCGGWFLVIGVLRTLQGRPDEVEGALDS